MPLYRINSCNELNRLIGYARFQYANEGKTDLVDNHWIALWFVTAPCNQLTADAAYVLLYAADTSTNCCCGVYKTKEMTTIDLRKAVSSIFLRPAAQHAWVSRFNGTYDYSNAIIGIIQIQKQDALNMLGIEGDNQNETPSNSLLNYGNLFPEASESRDKGWNELLKHQAGTLQNNRYHAKQCLAKGTIAIE